MLGELVGCAFFCRAIPQIPQHGLHRQMREPAFAARCAALATSSLRSPQEAQDTDEAQLLSGSVSELKVCII